VQAITVTEAALAEFEAAQAGPSNSVPIEEGQSTRKRRSRFDAQERTSAAPGALPMQVLDQIRVAKARSALEGNAPMGWAIGFPCAARDASGHWSPASVTAVTPEGYFQILWKDGTGVPVTMHKADCRPRDAAVSPLPNGSETAFLLRLVLRLVLSSKYKSKSKFHVLRLDLRLVLRQPSFYAQPVPEPS
jgi:hypothetical protein